MAGCHARPCLYYEIRQQHMQLFFFFFFQFFGWKKTKCQQKWKGTFRGYYDRELWLSKLMLCYQRYWVRLVGATLLRMWTFCWKISAIGSVLSGAVELSLSPAQQSRAVNGDSQRLVCCLKTDFHPLLSLAALSLSLSLSQLLSILLPLLFPPSLSISLSLSLLIKPIVSRSSVSRKHVQRYSLSNIFIS